MAPAPHRPKANRHHIRGGSKLPPEHWLPFWYKALDEELGYWLRVTERRLLVNALYEARTRAGDPKLEALMIFQLGADLIYIAKKEVELDAD